MSVAARSPEGASFPVGAFVRASSLHVGAAAAAAALRRDLVDQGRLSASAFDEAYAVARLTPGTNLLAMYTLLGERFAGWRGAFTALTVGALVPALIAVALGAVYVVYAGHSLAQEVMQGARAGAHRRVRVGNRETRPTATPAAPGPRSRTGGHHVGPDAAAANPPVRDSPDRRGLGCCVPED